MHNYNSLAEFLHKDGRIMGLQRIGQINKLHKMISVTDWREESEGKENNFS